MNIKLKCRIVWLLCLAGFWNWSCIRDANVELPNVPVRPVVHCFISPQESQIRADLYYSRPIYGRAFGYNDMDEPILNAQVKISGGGKTGQLLYNPRERAYMLPTALFSVVPGGNYMLEARLADGTFIDASCSIPATLNTTLSFRKSGSEQQINLEWDEILPGSYYRAGLLQSYWLTRRYFFPDNTSKDTLIREDNFLYGGSDAFQHNKTRYSFNTSYQFQSSDTVNGVLLITDKNYYNYHISLENYNGGDDPFSEATNIYTNINGGHGVFAGFQTYQKRVSP